MNVISRSCAIIKKPILLDFHCTISAVLNNTCQHYASFTVLYDQRTKQRQEARAAIDLTIATAFLVKCDTEFSVVTLN